MNLLFPRNNEILFYLRITMMYIMSITDSRNLWKLEDTKTKLRDDFQRKNVDSVDMSCEYKYVKSNWI
jgi:hypothetical protein